jgi:heme/copper-type cytochrome/quinol oxidase subunit 2
MQSQQPVQQPMPGTIQNQGVVTLGDWLITLLIAAIPIVGLIMLFVWGFGSNTNVNKANWAKATLIWVAVIVVLNLLVFLIIGVAFLTS